MIDLIQDFDKHEKNIADYISARINGYYGSDSFNALCKRMKILQNCNDLMPEANRWNTWNSNVTFPIVRERVLLRRAMLNGNYRASEIYDCSPLGNTPYEVSRNMTKVLNLNLERTKFKHNALRPAIDMTSKFGTSVFYTYWKYSSPREMRTVMNPTTGISERKQVVNPYRNVFTECIEDLRDYFQNPEIPNSIDSDFQGHVKRVHISDLVSMANSELYIPENLAKVIDRARKGQVDGVINDNRNNFKRYDQYDEKRWGVEVYRYEGTINIKGNEDDETNYICEMVGDEIIRLTADDYDRNIRSYTVLNLDKRHNAWWGISDSEYVVSHENFLNTILGMTLDSAMRSINQYIFFDKERINPSDLNNIMRNQGFVPVEARDQALSSIVMGYQPAKLDFSNVQYAVNAVQQSTQSISTKPDLSRKPNEGGLNNSTATAANIIAGQSDILETDLIESFDYGMENHGEKQVIMLQQFLPEEFAIRENEKMQEVVLQKADILGDFGIKINTTVSRNRQGEQMRMMNFLNWWTNVSQSPVTQGIAMNLLPIVKEITTKSGFDADQIVVEKPPVPPQMPQVQGVGMPQAQQQQQAQQPPIVPYMDIQKQG